MKTIEGNLLDITDGIILHQANCIGATGGLAGALRRKWPNRFKEYSRQAKSGELSLGGYLRDRPAKGETGPTVVHILGQKFPGPNTDIYAVTRALFAFSQMQDSEPIYAPYGMGCGLGGGDWSVYSKIIEKHLPHCIIVRRPEDK